MRKDLECQLHEKRLNIFIWLEGDLQAKLFQLQFYSLQFYNFTINKMVILARIFCLIIYLHEHEQVSFDLLCLYVGVVSKIEQWKIHSK